MLRMIWLVGAVLGSGLAAKRMEEGEGNPGGRRKETIQ